MFCKLFSAKKGIEKTRAENRGPQRDQHQECPSCGSRGNCVPHGKYTRSVIEYEAGKAVYRSVEIRRVRCGSCGHTHAVLPDHIIPYSTYSLLFILQVLAGYFLGLETVEELCRRYSISVSMLYEWKALFLEHKELWQGVLENRETSPGAFIRRLLGLPSYSSDFSEPFFLKTARSFLQRHKDAAYCRYAVF